MSNSVFELKFPYLLHELFSNFWNSNTDEKCIISHVCLRSASFPSRTSSSCAYKEHQIRFFVSNCWFCLDSATVINSWDKNWQIQIDDVYNDRVLCFGHISNHVFYSVGDKIWNILLGRCWLISCGITYASNAKWKTRSKHVGSIFLIFFDNRFVNFIA